VPAVELHPIPPPTLGLAKRRHGGVVIMQEAPPLRAGAAHVGFIPSFGCVDENFHA